MEDEKKKKKNKKKKGKQSKVTEDAAIGNGETASEQNHVADLNRNCCVQDTSNAQNAGVSESDVEVNSHKINEARSIVLEEEVRQLEAEKHSCFQKVKHLEEDLKQAVLDKSSWILKEASLQEKIRNLQNENDSCMQREANLEKELRQIQDEKDSWIIKEVSLVEEIRQLQSEKNSWKLKEASLEEKMKHLENDNYSTVLKENSSRETIARLTKVNVGLQEKVKGLEESRNSLLKENQQLVESASFLEARIQHLEREVASASSAPGMTKEVSKDEDASSLVEAAGALVEKLITENADLVEKVNELYIELNRRNVTATHSTAGFDPAMSTPGATIPPDSLPQHDEKVLISGERVDLIGSIPGVEDSTKEVNANTESVAIRPLKQELMELHKISEISEISEIVQIPLEENVIREIEENEIREIEENEIQEVEPPWIIREAGDDTTVPLTDAPLIGAPFRLISFMARYVSGADLVDKNSSEV